MPRDRPAQRLEVDLKCVQAVLPWRVQEQARMMSLILSAEVFLQYDGRTDCSGFGVHVVLRVTVVELSLVTLKPPDSEPLDDARLSLGPALVAFAADEVDRAADDLEDAALGVLDGLLLVLAVADLTFCGGAAALRGFEAMGRPARNG